MNEPNKNLDKAISLLKKILRREQDKDTQTTETEREE